MSLVIDPQGIEVIEGTPTPIPDSVLIEQSKSLLDDWNRLRTGLVGMAGPELDSDNTRVLVSAGVPVPRREVTMLLLPPEQVHERLPAAYIALRKTVAAWGDILAQEVLRKDTRVDAAPARAPWGLYAILGGAGLLVAGGVYARRRRA